MVFRAAGKSAERFAVHRRQIRERLQHSLNGAAAVFEAELPTDIVHVRANYREKRCSYKRADKLSVTEL